MPRALHVTALGRMDGRTEAISGCMRAPAQSQIYRFLRDSGGDGTAAHCSPEVLFVVTHVRCASNMSAPAQEPSTAYAYRDAALTRSSERAVGTIWKTRLTAICLHTVQRSLTHLPHTSTGSYMESKTDKALPHIVKPPHNPKRTGDRLAQLRQVVLLLNCTQ